MFLRLKIICASLLKLFAVAAWVSSPAYAGNGFAPIGTGAKSLSMGGADVAIVDDTNAIALNPAGLVQIDHQRVDANLYPFYNFDTSHSDALGNREDVNNTIGGAIGGGYAKRLEDNPDIVLGLGTFVAGGTGFVYNDLRTPFKNPRDDINVAFGAFRLSGGIGWQATERLGLRATVSLNYASVNQEFFPHTSDAGAGFFGTDLQDMEAIRVNASVGLQYQLTDALRIGWTYISETDLPLKDGSLTVNYSDIGEGRVKYRDVRLSGFVIPRESTAGLGWQITDNWLVAADIRWMDWSALQSSTLIAANPDNTSAGIPQSIRQSTDLNWRDQYVIGIGTAWDINDRHVLRGGFNAGRNPVPEETLSPLFNLIEEYEFELGYGYRHPGGFRFNTVLQYIPAQTVDYNNPDLPFGPSSEAFGVIGLSLDVAWIW